MTNELKTSILISHDMSPSSQDKDERIAKLERELEILRRTRAVDPRFTELHKNIHDTVFGLKRTAVILVFLGMALIVGSVIFLLERFKP